jgi:alpha-N-arabinofuranosidase
MYANAVRGVAIRPRVQAQTIATKGFGDVPAIDVAATIDQQTKTASVFIVHRGQANTLKTELTFAGPNVPTKVIGAQQIWGLDAKAFNSFDRPDVIVPRQVGAMPFAEGKLSIKLPPLSVTIIQFEI